MADATEARLAMPDPDAVWIRHLHRPAGRISEALRQHSSSDPSSLLQRYALVRRHNRAGRHLEQDGRAPFAVGVEHLHLDALERRRLPRMADAAT
jgi:hypothetical protein